MPRIYSSIDKIRAELAWVNEPVDPDVGFEDTWLRGELSGDIWHLSEISTIHPQIANRGWPSSIFQAERVSTCDRTS